MRALALPSGRLGRLLAIGVTLAAALLVWSAAVSPLLALYQDDAQILEQRQALYARMADLAARVPALRARAASREPAAGPGEVMLASSSDAIAGATLQQTIQEMVTRVGADMTSAEALPAMPVKGFRRIGVHVSLVASWPVLIALLRDIEQARPRMLVDDLQVFGRASVAQLTEPLLDAGLTVLALRPGDAATPGGAR